MKVFGKGSKIPGDPFNLKFTLLDEHGKKMGESNWFFPRKVAIPASVRAGQPTTVVVDFAGWRSTADVPFTTPRMSGADEYAITFYKLETPAPVTIHLS